MRRVAKLLILLLLLAALPLRGAAAVSASFCEPRYGDAMHAQSAQSDCEHCGHETTRQNKPGEHGPAACSHCAACSAGASLVTESARVVALDAVHAAAIPFVARQWAGFVPNRLDRPPLPL